MDHKKPLMTFNPIALQHLFDETLFRNIEKGTPVVETMTVSTSTEAPQSAVIAATEEFIYKGDKSSGILFILRYSDFPYFSPRAEDAFEKTLQAIGLDPARVAIVNLDNAHNPNDWGHIMRFFNPVKITLLGVEPRSLNLPEIVHNTFMKGKKATVFHTFSFEEMFADVEKKKSFWYQFRDFLKN